MILEKYKQVMTECMQMYMPISAEELSPMIDYSIHKRYKEFPCKVVNTYTNKTADMTVLAMADYIESRHPIVTAHGTMFKNHETVPNPMRAVVQGFLDARSKHKDKMFTFPKGSEDFEKYNLLQALDKIDCNSIYGLLGMYTSLLYNVNVATSVTSQGRALISTATMLFESFLADNVKFGSINEVLEFINNICKEERQYNDTIYLDHNINAETCFAKVMMECGYRWIPSDDEMEIIWRVINNLGQTDLNRVYYKNNLYEFLSNKPMKDMLINIMKTLKAPFFNPLKVPEEIKDIITDYAYIIKEYVYYGKMYIDRIDRCDNMIKSIIAESDTDSCIISLDAWYRFAYDIVKDEDLQITKYDPIKIVSFMDKDEFGDFTDLSKLNPISFEEPEESYDFANDEIIENLHLVNPTTMYPQDYLRFSITSIMGVVLDILINDYMKNFTINNNSHYAYPNNEKTERKCRIIMKNEFEFMRLLMTGVKKAYASMVGVQEGHVIPKEERLDIKGIASMAKSSMSDSTRKTLKDILLKDIMESESIDQFKLVNDLAKFEKKIISSIQSGSKEYYKPVKIKSISNYANPMSQQGIKASYVWNKLKPEELPSINLEERNSVDIAKVNLSIKNVDELKNFPEVYNNAVELLKDPVFKGSISSIAIPLDVITPDWVSEIIDYNLIINDNISGFPYSSVGIVKISKNTNYSNILQV